MTTVVVITGASAGIGRATALEFARQGCWLGLLAREPQRLQAACDEISRYGGKVVGVQTDVAHAEQVERAAERIERELGPIDIWVNNAMVTVFAPFGEMSAEEYERVTRVTYLGTVNGTRCALRRMTARDRGCILQVGSALAYRSIPLQSAYCGAKAAVRGFTDSIRTELKHDGSQVRIAMIQLSAFNTPQFDWARSRLPRRLQPVPPIFQPQLAARAIAWMAGHPRRELWVGWPAVKAILSTRLFPALGDRLAARGAWESQQTSEADEPRADNLFEPVPGAYDAQGRFGGRAETSMPQLLLAMHRAKLQWAAVAIAVVTITVALA
jgi:NAD(P)-dependent dehydrogenase (short-subunit alcohol dehydrogenase family)